MSPLLESFVTVSKDSHFPIQNIPFGVFSTAQQTTPRVGVAIGEHVLDLAAVAHAGLLNSIEGLQDPAAVFDKPALNEFMNLGKPVWRATRLAIQKLLSKDEPALRDNTELQSRALVKQTDVTMHLPAQIGDYTDFYCSREHATNVGIMFRGKDNALQPNWLHIPVGYHGRASSLVVSGTDLHRPAGQRITPQNNTGPFFAPSAKLDFELEVGWFVGQGNPLGKRIEVADAKDHIFGMVLVNDWSARDIQAWEYVPLGPFLGKNFGTTLSPWIVTLDALEEFLVDGPSQTSPAPLAYLQEKHKTAYDIDLEVQIKPKGSSKFERTTLSNLKYMYWSVTQQLAHHTVNGCNMRAGDMCATGTISGPEKGNFGSLLELSWNGANKITFQDGTERTFLHDGDEVNMTAYKDSASGYRIGFGDCRGKILPCLYAQDA
ncbi:fumarylacetoacetate hydrolase [Zychaea mexicana]|uniref:fumarylacetoacetate hydrolase n=1 Tax=Zychaea mexicana TaxID=64656 RepID=UPI0022FF21B0|nr:fumarylacetoacetate hydrolase [Zychaea mexicana]KAI9497866.1 fumarylacetoacetate hydrolase [Zychaea mexicana]